MQQTRRNAAVIIPVHNRKDQTLKCLDVLRADGVFDWAWIIVIDDGSNDGTEAAIREEFESTVLLKGNGNLWWTGAIRQGMAFLDEKPVDCFFWLNDDCLPAPGTMRRLFNRTFAAGKAIHAAQCLEPETAEPSYGGGRISGTRFVPVNAETSETISCDWLPGNLVCFPKSVIRDVGLPNGITFPHYYADAAYTLLAKRRGYHLALAGDCRATCKLTRHDFSILLDDFALRDLLAKYVRKQSGYYWRAFLGLHQIAFGRVKGTALYAMNVVARHSLLLSCRLLLPRKLNRWIKISCNRGSDIGKIRRSLPHCPLCESKRLSIQLDQANWKILSCRDCSNALTWPQPGTVDYVSQDFHASTLKAEAASFEDLPTSWQTALEQQLKLLGGSLASGARILEVGCGQGLLLERFARAGFRVSGLEASISAAQKARRRGLNVVRGEFPSDCSPGPYEAVIFSHVLEHIEKPAEVFAQIEQLVPGGRVLFVQSNWKGLIPRIYLERWCAWMPNEHFWHFTPKGLSMILAKRGWKVIAIQYSALAHDPKNVFANVARRIPILGDQFHLVAETNGRPQLGPA